MQLKGQNLFHVSRGDSPLKSKYQGSASQAQVCCRWIRLGLNFQILQEVIELSPSQPKLVKSKWFLQLLLLISPYARSPAKADALQTGSLPSVQPTADGTWWQALTRNPAYTKTCISRARDWSWLSLVNENQEWPGMPCTNVILQRATLAKTDKPLIAQQRVSFTAEGSWLQYLYRINIICSNVCATTWILKLALIHSRESPYTT